MFDVPKGKSGSLAFPTFRMSKPRFASKLGPKKCKRLDLPQSPRTPKPQKCILKSEKCHFGPPGKWPQKSIKISKQSIFGGIKMSKNGALDILIDFWGHFPGGPKWHFGTLKCTFGVLEFRGSVAGRGVCKNVHQNSRFRHQSGDGLGGLK